MYGLRSGFPARDFAVPSLGFRSGWSGQKTALERRPRLSCYLFGSTNPFVVPFGFVVPKGVVPTPDPPELPPPAEDEFWFIPLDGPALDEPEACPVLPLPVEDEDDPAPEPEPEPPEPEPPPPPPPPPPPWASAGPAIATRMIATEAALLSPIPMICLHTTWGLNEIGGIGLPMKWIVGWSRRTAIASEARRSMRRCSTEPDCTIAPAAILSFHTCRKDRPLMPALGGPRGRCGE